MQVDFEARGARRHRSRPDAGQDRARGPEEGNGPGVEGSSQTSSKASIANLEEKSRLLTDRWKAEKDKLGSAQKVKEELDRLRTELVQSQRQGRLRARPASLRTRSFPQLETKLKAIEGRRGTRASWSRRP